MAFIPTVDPVKQEKRHLQVATGCAGFIGIGFLISGVILAATEPGNRERWIGIAMILESIICFLLFYGLARGNRLAAILFLIYVIPAALPLFFSKSGANLGITIFAILFICIAGRAVLAAFRLRRPEFSDNDKPD